MKSQDVRKSFIDYFAERGHRPIASAPLVPHGDATLMFTNAGMVQFKDWFLGVEAPDHPRAVTVQKCLRVSGKHNDLENVGPSPRHHTFFEMLGNFSFGDYFKEEAIRFGWELVTERWGLDPAILHATVYEEDDEAAELWQDLSGLPRERIRRCGKADNFWAMGETGPCGPCSEIFVDRSPGEPEVGWEEGSESGRYLEIWNLVFMQYERHADGALEPLPNPSIDTGAGLERVAAVLQGVDSNYDSDLFQPILRAAAELAGTEYGRDGRADVSLRVIADHLRAVSFLLADGIIPGPSDRGYVLRRLLRRAVRHGMGIGFEEPFLHRLVPVLDEAMGGHYRELAKTREATMDSVREEEEKYLATRAVGARRIQEAIDRTRAAGAEVLPGEEIFQLRTTYGQEIETLREIGEEEKMGLDLEGYERILAEEKDRSRAVTSGLQKRMASLFEALHHLGEKGLPPSVPPGERHVETEFLGYGQTRLEGVRLLRLASTEGELASPVETLEAGHAGVVVTDRTVFYAESGGQVGDRGTLTGPGGRARVVDTQKDNAGMYYHFVEVDEGRLAVDDELVAEVDPELRRATERHHTGTHLLHAALHRVLGEGARQAGSLVAPDRLRFDFHHSRPLTAEQIGAIEDLVNRWVLEARKTEIAWRSRDEALAAGAMALFGEKYGDRVRTVEVPGLSLELCGGCHVRNIGEIGPVEITSERGVASGVRRIEALAGEAALDNMRRRRRQLEEIESRIGVSADRAAAEVGSFKERIKELEKELSQLRLQLVSGAAAPRDEATEVRGVKVLAREVPGAPVKELRNIADSLRDKLGAGVIVVASRDGGKVSVIVTVSKELTGRVHAGRMVKSLAAVVDGSGGGRPDFAQAGGKDPDKLPQLLASVPKLLAQQLEA